MDYWNSPFSLLHLRNIFRVMKQSTQKYNELLTRPQFNEFALWLFNGKCCIPGCSEDMADAHHIMDRKLFSTGGYYPSNCAPVCSKHHIDCENGTITPNELIQILKIPTDTLVKPDSLDYLTDEEYKELLLDGTLNKWGK